MENTPEATNKYESVESKIELLTSLADGFEQDLLPELKEYLSKSNIIFASEGMYNDEQQRTVLMEITMQLSLLSKRLIDLLTENPDLIQSIGHLNSQVNIVIDNLKAAPDARYATDELARELGGIENIPAGKPTYEDTRDSVIRLKSLFRGVGIAVKLLNE